MYISDVEREAIDAIKAKMAADPSYNPMSDPQAVAALDSLVSPEVKINLSNDWRIILCIITIVIFS